MLSIRKNALGSSYSDVVTSLKFLSVFYIAIGEYPKNEPLFRMLLAIEENALGLEHPDMTEFYKNVLSGKMKRNQALRHAVLKQKETVNQRYGYPSPLFWGAFVFMGEP